MNREKHRERHAAEKPRRKAPPSAQEPRHATNGRQAGAGKGGPAEPSTGRTAARTAARTASGRGASERPPLVAHPNANGGRLLAGGVPGNRGGTGRPPNVLRERMREYLEAEVLDDIVQSYRDGELDKMRVGDFLAKYGLGVADDRLTLEQVQDLLRTAAERVRDVLAAELEPEAARRIGAQIAASFQTLAAPGVGAPGGPQ